MRMNRYIVSKAGRLVGAIECTARTARMMRHEGYTVLPA